MSTISSLIVRSLGINLDLCLLILGISPFKILWTFFLSWNTPHLDSADYSSFFQGHWYFHINVATLAIAGARSIFFSPSPVPFCGVSGSMGRGRLCSICFICFRLRRSHNIAVLFFLLREIPVENWRRVLNKTGHVGRLHRNLGHSNIEEERIEARWAC